MDLDQERRPRERERRPDGSRLREGWWPCLLVEGPTGLAHFLGVGFIRKPAPIILGASFSLESTPIDVNKRCRFSTFYPAEGGERSICAGFKEKPTPIRPVPMRVLIAVERTVLKTTIQIS